MHILLADDHDLIRDTIEEFLKRLDKDLHVLHAANLSQALDHLRKADALDLVLLDLRMPGMNGLAGLKSVQAARTGVPIVILSGETNPDTIRNALQAGAAGFLPKTMRGTAMLNALRLILAGERYIPDIMVAGADCSGGRKRGQRTGAGIPHPARARSHRPARARAAK
jgi:DNA-binding NarL/FixJ family response regulator